MNISMRYGPLFDRKNIMPSRGVCRCLFGQPDHEELKKKLKRETEEIYEKQKVEYNFDFIKEAPVPGNGRYVWERVTRKDEIPPAYDMPGLAMTSHERLQAQEAAVSSRDTDTQTSTVGVTSPSASTDSTDCLDSENVDLELSRSETPLPNHTEGASSVSRGVKRKLRQQDITDFFPQKKKTHTAKPSH